MDVKKNIAYSTSIHLGLMAVLSIGGFFSIVVVYIILHGMIKGQLFQSSGYEIHGVGSQDIRKFNMRSYTMMIIFSMLMLSALVRMVIMRSKEVVVIGIIGLIILLLVVVSILYTLTYLNKLRLVSKVREAEGYYVLTLMLMSMVVIDVNFNVWMSLII